MVPLKVLTLVVAGQNQPSVLVLQPVEETPAGKARIVPIWIGPTEAAQIGMALEHVKFARPMTHDLMLDALTNLDARVDSMVIYGSKGQMFFAHLVLSQGGRLITLDARPSDAIALALPRLDGKLKGFADPDAVMTAPETRSSSPVRIIRDSSRQSSLRGLYPTGEGAGYAGGIMSAAIDGIMTAETIIMEENYERETDQQMAP